MLKLEAYDLMTRGRQLAWTYELVEDTHVFSCPEGYGSPSYMVTQVGENLYHLEWMGSEYNEKREWVEHPQLRKVSLEELKKWMDRFHVPNEIRPEQFQSLKSKNGKRCWIDGQWCRERRGKWVPIPKIWIGAVTYKETIMSRPSKVGGKRDRKNNRKRSEK